MKYTKKDPNPTQTGSKVGHFSGAFLGVVEAAEMLGKGRKTVVRWCKSGKLPAITKEYGDSISYQIPQQAVEMFLQNEERQEELKQRKKQIGITDHNPYVDGWQRAALSGLIGQGPYSQRTVNHYTSYLNKFLSTYKVVTFKNLQKELALHPNEREKRRMIYRSVVSFSKYLLMEDAVEKDILDKIAKSDFRPKPNPSPKQHMISEEDMVKLFQACKSKQDTAILALLANNGLRSFECAKLTLEDIDLEKGEVFIRKGKWGKPRPLGLNPQTNEVLVDYLENERKQVKHPYLFLNQSGEPMTRWGVYWRVERIARTAGVKAHPHAFRRRFVTHNLNLGRNPEDVRKACGHSSISTTMMYNKRNHQEVVDSMKNW